MWVHVATEERKAEQGEDVDDDDAENRDPQQWLACEDWAFKSPNIRSLPHLLKQLWVISLCFFCWMWSVLLPITILCDRMYHSLQQLVVVDNVEQVEGKEVAIERCSQSWEHYEKLLASRTQMQKLHGCWKVIDHQNRTTQNN